MKQTMFGGGVYVCPGRNAVRMFIEAALEVLTGPDIELTAEGDVEWATESTIHEITKMPVSIRRL